MKDAYSLSSFANSNNNSSPKSGKYSGILLVQTKKAGKNYSPNPLFKKEALKMKILNSVRRNEK